MNALERFTKQFTIGAWNNEPHVLVPLSELRLLASEAWDEGAAHYGPSDRTNPYGEAGA